MVRIEPWAYLLGALLILTLPLSWLVAAVCAAGFHEICHLAAVKAVGGRIGSFRIGVSGAVIDVQIEGKGKELICAIAGPVGSFGLLAVCHTFPKLAICGCIQGAFNLLPIYPLDGGRIVECTLAMLWPQSSEKWRKRIELAACLGIFGIVWCLRLGNSPLIMAAILIMRAVLRKIPCKRKQIRVQ